MKLKNLIPALALFTFLIAVPVRAAALGDDGTICSGVYAADMDLSGMSEEAARTAIESRVNEILSRTITLQAVGGNTVDIRASELGLSWYNTGIPHQAASLGRGGNVLTRLKERKALEHEKKIYDIVLKADRDKVESVLKEKCAVFDIKAQEPTLKRENGGFVVKEGIEGTQLDMVTCITQLKNYVEKEWDRSSDGFVALTIEQKTPVHTASELSQVRDVLGSYTTSFSSSGKGRSANVRNGCHLVDGHLLYPGEQLSVYSCVSPFTEENGYYLAGSYNKGLVVETLGGGICQVSSTLYNAVLRAELQVDQRSNHSMVVGYVDLSADAAISGTTKDFKFTNNTDYPVYISGSTTEDKRISFTIYGKEVRNMDRRLAFETEILSETPPEGDKVIADPSQPVGYVTSQSAHTGYSANYWKIVTEGGVEIERVKVNTSHYQAVPRTVTFGTAGDATGAMRDAISTQKADYCRQVAQNLVDAANAAKIAQAAEAAQAAAADAVD